MMLQGQLGESSQVPSILEMPETFARRDFGLLGNESIQFLQVTPELGGLQAANRRSRVLIRPAFKLAMLKSQIFAPNSRQRRVAESLAAVNAPQPTNLSLAQWKDIVEEIEDED
jgi:hypothetical protein